MAIAATAPPGAGAGGGSAAGEGLGGGDVGGEKVIIELPDTITPGRSQVEVDVAGGSRLRLLVPEQARPRDRLVLQKRTEVDGKPAGGGDGGEAAWKCSILRTSGAAAVAGGGDSRDRASKRPNPDDAATDAAPTAGDAPAAAAAAAPVGEAPAAEGGARQMVRRREVTAIVPEGVEAGRTRLSVPVGPDETILADLPASARPGDRLAFVNEGPDGAWRCRLERRVPVTGAGGDGRLRCAVTLTRSTEDMHGIYTDMVDAARAGGAFVNTKIGRGALPPLNIVGMVTNDALACGEELIRIPTALQLSVRQCRQVEKELSSAFAGLAPALRGRESEAFHATCLAKELRRSEARRRADAVSAAANGDEGEKERDGHSQSAASQPATAASRDASEEASGTSDDEARSRLWAAYADCLLCECFDEHPYWRSMNDPKFVEQQLAPSREHEYMSMMAGDVVAMYQCIERHIDPALLGPGFDLGIFLQARLCILTRVFHLDGDSCMVPVSDLFNHSAEPGVEWSWDDDRKEMVLSATRAHKAGEELFISYGKRSNVLLFRTYGFTLPPEEEPAWTLMLLGTARPAEVFAEYLPARLQRLMIHLECPVVQQSLVEALNGCRDHGRDPEEFLRKISEHGRRQYEEDATLAPFLDALRRAREKEPTSAAWWEHLTPEAHEAMSSGWQEQCVRVKMSEYLCAVAHFEIAEVLAGNLSEDRCLAGATQVRRILLEGLRVLRTKSRFSLTTTDSLTSVPAISPGSEQAA